MLGYIMDTTQSLDQCLKTYGRVDILHNNVGVGQVKYGGPPDVDEADWDRVIDTNIKSMFCLPGWLRTGGVTPTKSLTSFWKRDWWKETSRRGRRFMTRGKRSS